MFVRGKGGKVLEKGGAKRHRKVMFLVTSKVEVYVKKCRKIFM